MANTYYKQKVGGKEILLTALNPKMMGTDGENAILITIAINETDRIGVTLSEKEQDDLIAGILERRGVYWDAGILHGCSGRLPISSASKQKSRIHPAKS